MQLPFPSTRKAADGDRLLRRGIERMNFNEMTGMISNLMLQNYKIKTINYSI